MNRKPSYSYPLFSLLKSFVIQAIFLGIAFYYPFESIVIALLSALSAYVVRLSTIWILFNFFLPVVIFGSDVTIIPSWILALPVVLLAGLHLPALWTHVPYYPTPHECYEAIHKELPDERSITFLDIGCGISSLLIYLAQKRPDSRFEGIEISILPYLLSKIRSAFYKNVHISFKSIWSHSLSKYTVVYAFLSPAPMSDLWEKAKKEMGHGSLFISNSFEAPAEPTKVINVSSKRGGALFLYRIK